MPPTSRMIAHEPELIDTQLEERDGDTWVTGLCSFCWERVAFHAPPDGSMEIVRCPEGHPLRITRTRSAGLPGFEGAVAQ